MHSWEKINKSTLSSQHTWAFLSTSEDCSSSPSRAAWRNPPGRDAASYCRPLSVGREKIDRGGASSFPLTLEAVSTELLARVWTLFYTYAYGTHSLVSQSQCCEPAGRKDVGLCRLNTQAPAGCSDKPVGWRWIMRSAEGSMFSWALWPNHWERSVRTLLQRNLLLSQRRWRASTKKTCAAVCVCVRVRVWV